MRRLAWIVALSCAGACAPVPLAGMGLLESSRFHFQAQAYEDAAEAAEWLITEDQLPPLSPADEAEAAWLAGESRLLLEDHEEAFKHFKRLLETAPWSTWVAGLEARLFDIGLALLYDERYDGWIFDSHARGVDVMTTFQIHFSRSERADDALHHVGEYFSSPEQEAWVEASLTYEDLWKEYPGSEWAERSLWMAASCRLERVHAAGYNHSDLAKAHELLQASRRVHPRGAAEVQVRADLERAREMLALSHVIVADFYAARGKPVGEQLRLANAAVLFPETAAGRSARDRLLAAGLDPGVMAAQTSATSIDTRVEPLSPWEAEDFRGDRDEDAP